MKAPVALPGRLSAQGLKYVLLTGNPNCGKTTLFNALTGLRAKVGNYPGVTVERKEGRLLPAPKQGPIAILDLPGAYSLAAQSLDEQIARDVLLQRVPEVPAPDLVVVVVDASNLQRNLYFTTQVIELGYQTVVALNMVDVARENGHEIDAQQLEALLGVPVFPVVASQGEGISRLREWMLEQFTKAVSAPTPSRHSFGVLPDGLRKEVEGLAQRISSANPRLADGVRLEAVLALSDDHFLDHSATQWPADIRAAVAAARRRLEEQGIDWRTAAIEARYECIASLADAVTTTTPVAQETISDKLDRVLTHKVWGLLVFAAIMTLMFQSIFTFAHLPMTGLEQGVNWLGGQVSQVMQPSALRSLIVDGVIAGVGAVVVFLPQICLLFLFIGLLEDTGYMARAAFIMDRLMSRVGLHGKSFIPLLSSFACAIPGIMATRTIESPKDRLVTILVAPLMSCSARLPVYTLLIAACIPDRSVLGFLKLPGLTLFSMYLLGIVAALAMAWLFKKTLLKGPTPMLIMELPPYKRPMLRVVMRHMWDRAKVFLQQAGTIILGLNIILWFLASYPKNAEVEARYAAQRAEVESVAVPDEGEAKTQMEAAKNARLAQLESVRAGELLRSSYAGRIGKLLEPVIEPLGFDWKMGVGILSSFAAREVFVSTMSLVYNMGNYDASEAGQRALVDTMKAQLRPGGRPVYTPLVALTLMVFYVFALQCASTVAIVHRETNSWKWPVLQWTYMGALAWVLAFLTYQGGRLLGFE